MTNKEIVMKFLNNCSIIFENYDQLNNMLIPRNVLLSVETYDKVRGDIQKMKKLYSSGSLTSLQKNAKLKQILKLIRTSMCLFLLKTLSTY